MTAAFVSGSDRFPDAGPFDLHLIGDDGEAARIMPNGDTVSAEVWITSNKNAEGLTLIVPVNFATLELAKDAASILADAFEQVRTLQAQAAPYPCLLAHRLVSVRKSRHMGDYVVICERCAATFVPEPNQ